MRVGTLALVLAVGAGGCRSAGELTLGQGTRAEGPPGPLLAGTADVVFTPPPGYPLGGYGGGDRRDEWPLWFGVGWPGRLSLWWHQRANEEGPARSDMLKASTGVHDELTARALVLRPAGGAPLALVRIDAIGVTRELHDLVVGGLYGLGYTRSTVLLTATHTHSGVGAFMRAPLARLAGTDNFRPEIEARIADACVRAVREAHEGAVPAALGVGRARDAGEDGAPIIARNRNDALARDDVDREILLLRVDDLGRRRPLAVVINYAVHPTVLGPSNLQYSGDVADGLEDEVSARLGGVPVLFVQGAEGDIAPNKPKGTPGGFRRIRALGELMADLVVPALEDVEVSPEARLVTATGELEMGEAHAVVAAWGRARFVDDYRDPGSFLLEPLVLPLDATLWLAGLTNVKLRLTWSLALGMVVDLDGLVGRTETRVGAVRIVTGRDDVAILTVPGEATHDVGEWIKSVGQARGATATFVAGLAQDHVGYLASEPQFHEGGYEARFTLFGPKTARHVVHALERLMTELGYPPAAPAAKDPPVEGR